MIIQSHLKMAQSVLEWHCPVKHYRNCLSEPKSPFFRKTEKYQFEQNIVIKTIKFKEQFWFYHIWKFSFEKGSQFRLCISAAGHLEGSLKLLIITRNPFQKVVNYSGC